MVRRLAAIRPIRIGTTRADNGTVDQPSLDAFLRNQRVFLSYAREDAGRLAPFVEALQDAGFVVVSDIDPGQGNVGDAIDRSIAAATRDGWVLVFWSSASSRSLWVRRELDTARAMGGRILSVLLDRTPLPAPPEDREPFDGSRPPAELVRYMLTH